MSLFSELKRRNVVRVAFAYVVFSWLLIQVVETIFPAFGFGDAAIRTVVIVLAIGLPLVLILSWVYELTPEGLKLEKEVDRSRSTVQRTGKILDRAIIVVLTLAVGIFSVDKFLLDPARDTEIEERAAERARSEALTESFGENSIAVLPFVNMSLDASNEYFSDGISEELLNLLQRIPKLRVISRSSSFAFKGKDVSIPKVAEQLNVSLVLEGSVRKQGDRVRITAQLIEARSDTHLWSDTYDRTLDDIFAIQDEISAAIVNELSDQLGLTAGEAPTAAAAANTEAHDAFLRGRYLIRERTPESKKAAVAEFEKAISFDPDFAPAHAELVIAYLLGGSGDVPHDERIAKAEHHVERAMALAPGLAEAHAAKAWLMGTMDKPGEEVLPHFRRAIEINPSYAIVYSWMSDYLSDFDESFAAIETGLRLDPLSRSGNFGYVHGLIERNRLVEADRQIEKFAAIEPRGATLLRGARSSLGGNWANWMLAYLEAANDGPDDLVFGQGHRDFFRWYLISIGLEEEAVSMSTSEDILILAAAGHAEEAIKHAKVTLAENPDVPWARFDLAFARLMAGQYAEARPYLDEQWQRRRKEWTSGEFVTNQFIAALVTLRRDAGDEAGADQILAEIRNNIRRLRDAGLDFTMWMESVDYLDGMVAYLAGDRDTGLALMSKAAEDGYWIPHNEAFQQSMTEDPGYALIIEGQKARQARERNKLLRVVCNDNPFATAWQPTDETCEQYFASAND